MQLKQEITKMKAAAKAIIDKAKHEGRDLTADEQKKFDGYCTKAEALQHGAVQGDFFAGAHKDMTAGAKSLGFHIAGCAIVEHLVGNAGPGSQQGLDRAARTTGGALLHKLAYAVKQHHAHGFRQLPKGYGCNGGSTHQREFVEKVLFQDALRANA